MMDALSPGYNYLRSAEQLYVPQTLNAALLALRQGMLPPEGVVYLMNRLGPLDESPSNFSAFDRLLSRPGLDLKTVRFLMGVFLRGVHHPDTDTALYAAESLNFLEVRYNSAASEARRLFLAHPGDAERLRAVLRAEHRLMLLNQERRSLCRHHAGEIIRLASAHRSWFRLRLSDTLVLVAAYRVLGALRRARRLLESCRRRGLEHPRLDLVRADLAFREGRAEAVALALRNLGRSWGTGGTPGGWS